MEGQAELVLVATDDQMIPLDAQRAMSKRAGSTVEEAGGSHAIYVSEPEAVAKLYNNRCRSCIGFASKVVDVSHLKRYSMFVLDVVKAHALSSPKYPQIIHYRGDGVFMVSGRSISFRKKFKKENL